MFLLFMFINIIFELQSHIEHRHCRQLHLIDYADEGTRLYYSSTTVRVFGLIKPEAMGNMGSLISKLQSMFTLNRLKMIEVSDSAAQRFSCSRGMGIAVEATVSGEQGSQWSDLVASDASTFYGSTGEEFVSEDSRLTFGAQSRPKGGSRGGDVTACIIKPHIIKASQLGDLISNIAGLEADGIRIEEVEMFNFDKTAAASFFDVYKGLFTYYENMIDHMIEGPSVYLKLSGGNVVEAFRECCGPPDVGVARHLRPKSLRAQFGTDRVSFMTVTTCLLIYIVSPLPHIDPMMLGVQCDSLY